MSNHIYIVQEHLVPFITDSFLYKKRCCEQFCMDWHSENITDLGLLNDRVSLCDSLRLCTLPSFKLSTIFSFISSCHFSTAPFDNFDSIMMKCCCCPSAPKQETVLVLPFEYTEKMKMTILYNQ